MILLLVKATVILAAALAGVRLARRSRAVRHLVLTASFGALLLLPVTAAVGPSYRSHCRSRRV